MPKIVVADPALLESRRRTRPVLLRDIVAVTSELLARAGRPFPAGPVRTLDAIHLATAELPGEPLPLIVLVARDAHVRDNAVGLGCAIA